MSIPLVSNVGFTEVNSDGNLNNKAGTTTSKLPIQLFKLTGNISGNLTMSNDNAHQKIIIDTNGNTILDPNGSPITNNNPNTTVELKGSGNVQSTLKTFTSSVASASNTGTTTISTADNSTMAITTGDHTFIGTFIDDNRNAHGGIAFGDGNTTVLWPVESFRQVGLLVNETYYNTATTTNLGGVAMTNANRADFGMTFTHAFSEDGTPISGALTGPGGPSSLEGRTSPDPSINQLYTYNGVAYRYMKWNSVISGVNNGNGGTFNFEMFINAANGQAVMAMTQGRGAFNQIKNVDCKGVTAGRRFTFTNNLAIPCVLSGGEPYSNVTVNAGATAVSNRDSTDGSFNITGTISGNDGSNQPFAILPVNNGSGDISVTSHTGTRSVSAF